MTVTTATTASSLPTEPLDDSVGTTNNDDDIRHVKHRVMLRQWQANNRSERSLLTNSPSCGDVSDATARTESTTGRTSDCSLDQLDRAPTVPYHRPPSRESLDKKNQKQLYPEKINQASHRRDSLNSNKNERNATFRNRRVSSLSSSIISSFNNSFDSSFDSSLGSSCSFRSSSIKSSFTRCSINNGNATKSTGGKAVLLFDMTDQMLQEHDRAELRGRLRRDDDVQTSLSSITSYGSLNFGDDAILRKPYRSSSLGDFDDDTDSTTSSYYDETTSRSGEDDIYFLDALEEDDDEDFSDDEKDDESIIANGVADGEDSDDCSISTCSTLDFSVHSTTADPNAAHCGVAVIDSSPPTTVADKEGVGRRDLQPQNLRVALRSILKRPGALLASTPAEIETKNNKENHVQFDQNVRVKPITHLNDMSDDQVRTLYMNSEEAYEIRYECLQLVQQLEDEGVNNPTSSDIGREYQDEGNYCIRGLEKHTAKNNEELLQKREMLYASVFKIQSLCLPPGLMDIEATIADICIKLTNDSLTKARQFGLLDEREAAKNRT